MFRTFRYPLKPTKAQLVELDRQLEYYRTLYNAALEERKSAWRLQHRSITAYDQCASLKQLRDDDDETRSVAAWTSQQLFRRLDKAYAAFFRRLKAGETPGFPRFKSRDRFKSFDVGAVKLYNDRFPVPKIGRVHLNLYRPLQGTVKNVTLRKEADGCWFACFKCDLGPAPVKVAPQVVIGIDVGLKTLIATSDGELIDNPRFAARAQQKLAARQRKLSLKKRGSKSRQRQKRLLSKAHIHVRNQRRDHAWKTARYILAQCDAVAFEALDIAGMVQHGNLSRSIHDAAWRQLIDCLKSKAEEAGKWAVAVDPRGTTQKCSGCGQIIRKTLADRTHECTQCGLVLDRDVNAARNIQALGLSMLFGGAAQVAHSGEARAVNAPGKTPAAGLELVMTHPALDE